jgi:hypothetical protein
MKRFLLAIALVAVVGATYVATAPGSQTAGPTAAQFNALKRQVGALRKQVGRVKDLAYSEAGLLIDCVTAAVAIRAYGDYTTVTGPTYGYSYSDPNINGGTPFPETALNITASTDPEASWMTVGGSACKNDIGAAVHKIGRYTGLRLHPVAHPFSARTH